MGHHPAAPKPCRTAPHPHSLCLLPGCKPETRFAAQDTQPQPRSNPAFTNTTPVRLPFLFLFLPKPWAVPEPQLV